MSEAKDDSSSPIGFDITVTHRDRSGAIVKQDPYTLVVADAAGGGKNRFWERPKGSGNVFNRKGEPIGRYLRDEKTGRGKFIAGEAHVYVPPPLSKEEQLAKQAQDQAQQIKVLQAELAAVRQEREPKKAELKSKAKADEV